MLQDDEKNDCAINNSRSNKALDSMLLDMIPHFTNNNTITVVLMTIEIISQLHHLWLWTVFGRGVDNTFKKMRVQKDGGQTEHRERSPRECNYYTDYSIALFYTALQTVIRWK